MLQSINCAVVSVDVKLIGSIQLWNESQSQLKTILLKLNNYSNSNVNIDAHFHTFIIDSGGHTNQILVDCIGVVSDFDADHVVVKKRQTNYGSRSRSTYLQHQKFTSNEIITMVKLLI